MTSLVVSPLLGGSVLLWVDFTSARCELVDEGRFENGSFAVGGQCATGPSAQDGHAMHLATPILASSLTATFRIGQGLRSLPDGRLAIARSAPRTFAPIGSRLSPPHWKDEPTVNVVHYACRCGGTKRGSLPWPMQRSSVSSSSSSGDPSYAAPPYMRI